MTLDAILEGKKPWYCRDWIRETQVAKLSAYGRMGLALTVINKGDYLRSSRSWDQRRSERPFSQHRASSFYASPGIKQPILKEYCLDWFRCQTSVLRQLSQRDCNDSLSYDILMMNWWNNSPMALFLSSWAWRSPSGEKNLLLDQKLNGQIPPGAVAGLQAGSGGPVVVSAIFPSATGNRDNESKSLVRYRTR